MDTRSFVYVNVASFRRWCYPTFSISWQIENLNMSSISNSSSHIMLSTLPLDAYSQQTQIFGGSMQAPMNGLMFRCAMLWIWQEWRLAIKTRCICNTQNDNVWKTFAEWGGDVTYLHQFFQQRLGDDNVASVESLHGDVGASVDASSYWRRGRDRPVNADYGREAFNCFLFHLRIESIIKTIRHSKIYIDEMMLQEWQSLWPQRSNEGAVQNTRINFQFYYQPKIKFEILESFIKSWDVPIACGVGRSLEK